MAFGGRRRLGGLDRGQGVHGASWVFVTGTNEVIDYKSMRIVQDTDAKWKAFRKNHPDWELFKSKKEARRYVGLRMLERAGQVKGLKRQVRIDLLVTRPDGLKQKIGVYVADFTYQERVGLDGPLEVGGIWVTIIEDAKGYAEDLYKWKKAHVEAQLGVQIRET